MVVTHVLVGSSVVGGCRGRLLDNQLRDVWRWGDIRVDLSRSGVRLVPLSRAGRLVEARGFEADFLSVSGFSAQYS